MYRSKTREMPLRLLSRAALGLIAVCVVAPLAAADPDVPADWLSAINENIRKSEYYFSKHGDNSWSAPNRAHNLRSRFTSTGFELTSRTDNEGAWTLTLRVVRFGRIDMPVTAISAEPVGNASSLRYQRENFVEWYDNDERGLKQNFSFTYPPAGNPGRPLVIELALGGELGAFPTSDGRAILFKTAAGEPVVRYAGLYVEDASGRELESTMEVLNGRIRITIDARGAVYPVEVDPLMTSPAWSVEGSAPDDNLGQDVATAGDVNGDGYSDVIVGARLFDNGEPDEGRAYVYYGSASGLPAIPPSAGEYWTAEGDVSGAEFGESVSTAGDVNGDGYSDVIVGAESLGSAHVYHGSASGLDPDPGGPSARNPGNPGNADWSAAVDGRVDSVATGGDVNGDGYSDVIIGNRGANIGGRVYVFHGSASGLSNGQSSVTQIDADWIAESDQPGGRFGLIVGTAGDVNGDGYNDVIVGANLFDNGGAGNQGAAFVYHGSAVGLPGGPTATLLDADWTVIDDQADSLLGTGVGTAGDVNGDGFGDVIVGALLPSRSGEALVYYGSSSGLSGGPDATPTDADWTQHEGGRFGVSVATAGDVNGDGYADVIVGAYFFNSSEGAAFVYHGSAAGLPGIADWIPDGTGGNAEFGISVATAGDVNGDGYSDVIVGARFHDVTVNGSEGKAYVYHGSAAGLVATEGWTAESDQAIAKFGISVSAAGDVNGDGYSDVIVGARDYDNGEAEEGRAYVYLGSVAGLSTVEAWTAESDQESAELGVSVSTAGDVNGDGYSDVIVGARGYDNDQVGEGRAYVYHGSAAGLSSVEAWTAESDQAGGQLGISVSTAGDVNGDGYSDVIVAAPPYDNGETDEGRAYVYLGSTEGLNATAAWTAEGDQETASFGFSVSTAGDVNGDGYSDVIVGANTYDNGQADEGGAFVYLGSATGLNDVVAWTAESDQAGAALGYTVSTAGDINGDGYSDVIVGAYLYDNGEDDEGSAFVYYGSSTGLDPDPGGPATRNPGNPGNADWAAESDQAGAAFGLSVSTAGDVNGDGYSDVIVGAETYDNGEANEGRAFVYQGSAVGLSSTAGWTAESDQTSAWFGYSVSNAGDVNGDGYSDVIVGAMQYTNGETDEGRVFLYYGNNGSGLDRVPNQLRADGTAPIALLGELDSESTFRLRASGRTPAGRGRVRLEWEVEPLGTAFDGANLGTSATFVDTGFPGSSGSLSLLEESVTGLSLDTVYHWRLRIASDDPLFPHSVWFTPVLNSVTEADFRTPDSISPTVNGVTPVDNALNVSTSADVTVVFSEAVNEASVTTGTFRLLDGGGIPITAADVAVSVSGLIATFDPDAALSFDTLYTVEVTSGVEDLAGQSAVAFESQFRTQPAPSPTTPIEEASNAGAPPQSPTAALAGSAAAGAGDLNQDGINDVLAGAPGYVVGSDTEAGAALVYFGSAVESERETPDITFTGDASHDRAGVAVAGDFDFNGDGIPDILIGAEQINRSGTPDPVNCPSDPVCGNGKVYLIYFDPTDLTHYPNIGNPAMTDTVSLSLVGGAIPGVVFTGVNPGDEVGFALSAGGHFNAGDGDDIAIGAPGRDVIGTNEGTVYVIFDDPTLSGTVDLSLVADGTGSQVDGVVYEGGLAGGELGFSVVFAGDVAGPPGEDLAMGAPLATPTLADMSAPAQAGVAYVAAGGLLGSGIIEVCPIGISIAGGQVLGDQDGMRLGYALARGGDNHADGHPDLLIGAPLWDVRDELDAVVAADVGLVLQTSQALGTSVIEASFPIDGVTWTGATALDELGRSVAGVGDVTGNGLDDIVLGAPGSDLGAVDGGAVFLVEGLVQSGSEGIIEVCPIGNTIAGQVFVGITASEQVGSSVAATGDVSDDGDDDFAVGAPGNDAAGTDAGTVYLVLESEPPPPGLCGVNQPCTVADLSSGAQLSLEAGALAAETELSATGVLDPQGLPASAPAGLTLLGAGDFDPEGQPFQIPLPELHVPLRDEILALNTIGDGTMFGLYRHDAGWTITGDTATVEANPHYPSSKAALVQDIGELRFYAVFINDIDGDGIQDSEDPDRDGDGIHDDGDGSGTAGDNPCTSLDTVNCDDSCPDDFSPAQVDCDLDLEGDACDADTTDGDTDGVDDSCDNCPSISNADQADGDADGIGDLCDACPEEDPNDQDGDGICCPLDNCCATSNASQFDADSDGAGDACDTNPVILVSSDVADTPDFTAIQPAVDAAVESGTTIRILPGLGPYVENVTLVRSLAFNFTGVDEGSGNPVVDGGTGAAFDIQNTLGASPIRFRDLILRGEQTGLVTTVSTRLESLSFESATATPLALAVNIDGGTHDAVNLSMDATVDSGVDVAADATLALHESEFRGLQGTAIEVSGNATVETLLIVESALGIRTTATGDLTLRHTTVANGTGAGVDGTAGGSVLIEHSILYGNAGGDLLGGLCPSAFWSDVGNVDCTSQNDNLQTDPLFVGSDDYRLQATSSVLDHGPDPALFTGVPCLDLDNEPRQSDHDGNGLAEVDPGAYERANSLLLPDEIGNARVTGAGILEWDADPGAQEYHVYRGTLSTLDYGDYGACLDGNLTETQMMDLSGPPASGDGYFYMITADDTAGAGGAEGSLGMGACSERTNFLAVVCP